MQLTNRPFPHIILPLRKSFGFCKDYGVTSAVLFFSSPYCTLSSKMYAASICYFSCVTKYYVDNFRELVYNANERSPILPDY